MTLWIFGSTYADTAALAITRHVAVNGAPAPPSRQIARDARMSPSSLSTVFDSRDDMIRRATTSWAEHHVDLVQARVAQQGWEGFLPVEDEPILEARAWLCWRAMSVGDAEMAGAIARADDAQRQVLSDHLRFDGLDLDPEGPVIRATSSLLCGLADAVAAEVGSLAVPDAVAIWRGHRSLLLGQASAA